MVEDALRDDVTGAAGAVGPAIHGNEAQMTIMYMGDMRENVL